ncbi:hypothetical protein ACFSVK_01745 [Azorhizophilus paspali]|uniref:hypothetical protein n=1 Tax=Azorhizophilus paspali TaxID=69963 RepID=UPI003637AC6B
MPGAIDRFAARIWFAACSPTVSGGVILPFRHLSAVPVIPAVAGNGLVIFGFWLFRVGARRFHTVFGSWLAA